MRVESKRQTRARATTLLMNSLSPRSSHEAAQRYTSQSAAIDQPMIERLIPYLLPYHAVLGRSFTASKPPAPSLADTRRTG